MSARRIAIAANGLFAVASPSRSERLTSFTMTISSSDRTRTTSKIEAMGRTEASTAVRHFLRIRPLASVGPPALRGVNMKIGIIGAGNIGGTLARRLAAL